MKLKSSLLLCILLISCRSQTSNFFIYKNYSYDAGKVYAYETYNSKTKEYHVYEFSNTYKVDKNLNISLSESEISELYKLYKQVNFEKRKLCFIDNNNVITSETVFYFTNKDNNQDISKIRCLKNEKEQSKMSIIEIKFLNFLKHKKEYKEAFLWKFETM